MEWYYWILVGIFLLAVFLFYPALQKYRVFQFYSLIGAAFATGWFFSDIITLHTEKAWYGYMLLLLLIIGLLLKSFKFYRTMK